MVDQLFCNWSAHQKTLQEKPIWIRYFSKRFCTTDLTLEDIMILYELLGFSLQRNKHNLDHIDPTLLHYLSNMYKLYTLCRLFIDKEEGKVNKIDIETKNIKTSSCHLQSIPVWWQMTLPVPA